MYHYFYKITNTINNKYYYGIHSTDDLNDGYMGSGGALRRAERKYGKENFVKEIIKFFDTREECAQYENIVVNESLVNDPMCYNISLGGEQTSCKGTTVVYDNVNNEYIRILLDDVDDKRYFTVNTGKMIVFDAIDNKYKRIDVSLYDGKRYINGCPFPKNSIFVYNINDPEEKIFMINKNDFDESIHKISKSHFQKGKVLVKDNAGNRFFVNVDDERYISGELQANYTGYKFTDEQKSKLKQKFKAINHQKGEKNSQFGTKWITKDGTTIKVKKEVLNDYLDNGWKLGMK